MQRCGRTRAESCGATRLLEEVLQVLDLALELAQLRKPLLVLPLLSVELGDQRLLLGARQRAAAAVGDARRRPLLPARLDARLERIDAGARAVDGLAERLRFLIPLPQRRFVLLDQRALPIGAPEALERLDGERAVVEETVVGAESQPPRTSFRAMSSAASSVSERPTFSTPCRTFSRRAAASAAAAARAASAAAAAA